MHHRAYCGIVYTAFHGNAHIVEKSGAWYNYGEIRLGQGRETGKKVLAEDPDMRDKIVREVRIACNMPVITRSEESAGAVTPVEKPKKK